jgi:LCP family protein required for cell wall assembly
VSSRTRRLLRRVALGVAALLLVLGGTAYGAYRYYDSRITRIALPALGSTTSGAAATADVSTGEWFLLAGSDTRSISDGASFQSASTATAVTGERADTVMLVHLPAGSAKATIMSFPRDSYVTIPSYTSPSGKTTAAHQAKLNEAFALGGANLLVSTIEALTGLQVDHYLQVDFDGFRDIVDAVGGVTLCVGTTRRDTDSGDMLTAGVHANVTGAVALAFVRDRKGLAAGDLARIQDQQYFLSQLLHKVLSAGTLTNPARLTSLLSAATAALTVDSDFGLAQFKALATHLSSLNPSRVTFVTLPITTADGRRTIHGLSQSVVLLDETKLPAAFAALAGTTTAVPSPASTTATKAPTPTTTRAVTSTTSATLTCAP